MFHSNYQQSAKAEVYVVKEVFINYKNSLNFIYVKTELFNVPAQKLKKILLLFWY